MKATIADKDNLKAGNKIVLADNLAFIRTLEDGIAQLIYIDPPFNTGKQQERVRLKTSVDENGDRNGYKGKRYKTTKLDATGYDDQFGDFQAFLQPRLIEARRLLASNGSFFLHIDYREVHYCKIALDKIFGRECFMNEIIWAYDYGARSKKKWSAKHDTILWYVKDPKDYAFNYDEMDRIPYMAPGLVGLEKAARGKTPTDVWWHTIVSPNGKEKNGYATQKPLGVLERIIKIHSNKNDLVVDFFAGSGSIGDAAAKNNRRFLLVDSNSDAIGVMKKRLKNYSPSYVCFNDTKSKTIMPNQKQYPKGKKVDKETKIFSDVAGTLEERHASDDSDSEWKGKQFEWIKGVSAPSRRGAIGKELVANWCALKGMNVRRSLKKEVDRVIGNKHVQIKLSLKWENGTYRFQQIKGQEYDYLICLGISPNEIHCWVISKREVLREWQSPSGYITSQHTGSGGTETAWFEVNPNNPSRKLSGCGGSLADAFNIIQTWQPAT